MKKKSDEKTLNRKGEKSQRAEPEITADAGGTDAGVWESDQKKRGYYYDDSHGYEIYDPGADDEEDDDE